MSVVAVSLNCFDFHLCIIESDLLIDKSVTLFC